VTLPLVPLRAALGAAFLLLQAQAAPFVFDLWPGEGRPRFTARAAVLELRQEPSTAAAVATRLTVVRGAAVRFDETRVRTVRAGRIVVLSAGSLRGRDLGATDHLTREAYYAGGPSRDFPLAVGAVLEHLQDRAEGTCFVRVAGSVVDAESCPTYDTTKFRVESAPAVEWWVRVLDGGRPVGWLLVTDATVRQGPRSF
jgi:hypothetical protein